MLKWTLSSFLTLRHTTHLSQKDPEHCFRFNLSSPPQHTLLYASYGGFRVLDMQKITLWQSPHPASSPGPCGSISCCSACSLSHAEFRPSRRRCHRVRFSSCSVLSVELTYSVGRRCRFVCVFCLPARMCNGFVLGVYGFSVMCCCHVSQIWFALRGML